MPGRLAQRTERRGEAPPCHGFSPFAHQSLVDRFRFSAEYSAPLARRQCHAGTWQRWCAHTVNCSPRCAFLLPITKNGCCHRLIAYSFCACFWSLRSLSLGVCLAVWLWTLAAPQSAQRVALSRNSALWSSLSLTALFWGKSSCSVEIESGLSNTLVTWTTDPLL